MIPPTPASPTSAWRRAATTARCASAATSSCCAQTVAGTGGPSCPCRTVAMYACRSAARASCRPACRPRPRPETATCSTVGGPLPYPAGNGMCLATRAWPGSTRRWPMPSPAGCAATSALRLRCGNGRSVTRCRLWAAARGRSWPLPRIRPAGWTSQRRPCGSGRRTWGRRSWSRVRSGGSPRLPLSGSTTASSRSTGTS